MAALSPSLVNAFVELGIDPQYHDLLAELAGGEKDYLIDIVAEDLEGREDADGVKMTMALASDLVRKLRQEESTSPTAQRTPIAPSPLGRSLSGNVSAAPAPGPPMLSRGDSLQSARSNAACRVSLLRSPSVADSTLVRCALRGELPEGGEKRRKILAVVLDRSGSMAGAMWRRLVDGVANVVSDKLLADSCTTICLVVYSDDAREVWIPSSTAELRELLLSREYSPQGGTSFKAAFELTQTVVDREVCRYVKAGVQKADIDIATLVFTDGEDTSVKGRAGQYGVRLVDKEASSSAARNAGDAFRRALQKTGCPTYVCIAAFGADHDPDQCQYLSDRYYFINRGEVLSEVLAGGLGALLNSAGQCRLRIDLPDGATLAEVVPETLPLDASGRLEHHIWLQSSTKAGALHVSVDVADVTVLEGTVMMGVECAASVGSFEDHLFLVDFIALQLRRIARELCGRRPSGDELTRLRARLLEAKDKLQPTKEASSVATGQLRGRAVLRERVAEVEALRERLSYALGQFDERDTNDERKIGTTAIDAILRDAGQHVPQGAVAAALTRRAEILAELPAPETLSTYGKEFTTDAYSYCDAYELASQGDALFFQLKSVKVAPNGCGFVSAVDCPGLVSLEAFVLLSRDGKQAIKGADAEDGFTHVGFPLYATEGHFLRARVLLPDVLQRLGLTNTYEQGSSERQLLSLLGRSLSSSPVKSEMELIALLHKVRSTRAVLSATIVNEEVTLLDTVIAEAKRFIQDSETRAETLDLYGLAAAGILAGDDEGTLLELGNALTHECLRRRIEDSLRSTGVSKRLCLASSLLGPVCGEDSWLDVDLPCPDAGESEGSFNPFTAPAELEALEEKSPGQAAPHPEGVKSLLAILSAKREHNLPRPSEWSTLKQQLVSWSKVLTEVGGIDKLCTLLDALMTEDDACHMESLQRILALFSGASPKKSLRGAFSDVASITKTATSACLGDTKCRGSLRHTVAAEMRAVVASRKAMAIKYPISGACFPSLEEHTGEFVREVWGAPANPTDPALHHKAALRVWRRTMKCRITMTTKEALTDKEYRKRGGKFVFPSPLDTFIRGLHQRTRDLHRDWRDRLEKETSGDEAREEAVEEMLLRLRWDDNDSKARAKLKQIVARIWDDLEGVDLTGKAPISSALWLDDTGIEVCADETTGVAQSVDKDVPSSVDHANKTTTSDAPLVTPETQEAGDGNVQSAADHVAETTTSSGATAEPPATQQAREENVAGSSDQADQTSPSSSAPLDAPETRQARDGNVYTHAQFMEYYGERAADMWDEACESAAPNATEDASPASPTDAAPDWNERERIARARMDGGLQAALDDIPAETQRSMERFAENQNAGSRMKLPLTLSAKQRKAVHLWAEMNRCEHRSFGYRGRRRLHLSVGAAPTGDDSPGDGGEDAWSDYDEEQEED